MQTPQELFVYELQDAYAAEQAIAQALDHLSQEQTDQQLQQIFHAHRAETQTHLNRLHEIFNTLGQQPANVRCEGAEGIIDEHHAFVHQNQPAPQVHTLFDVGAAERVEHYEIATYEGLVRMADALGMDRASELLQANLTDERQQLGRLQDAAASMTEMQASQQAGGQPMQGATSQPQAAQSTGGSRGGQSGGGQHSGGQHQGGQQRSGRHQGQQHGGQTQGQRQGGHPQGGQQSSDSTARLPREHPQPTHSRSHSSH